MTFPFTKQDLDIQLKRHLFGIQSEAKNKSVHLLITSSTDLVIKTTWGHLLIADCVQR